MSRIEWSPPYEALTGNLNKDGFARHTLLIRVPVILTQIIDTVCRRLQSLPDKEAQQGKSIIADLSKLRYELQCNKRVTSIETKLLSLNDKDAATELSIWMEYDQYFASSRVGSDQSCCWLDVPWLYAECLIYRKVAEIFTVNQWLQNGHDYFHHSKQVSFQSHLSDITAAAASFKALCDLHGSSTFHKDVFLHVIRASLWGNQADLSLNAGKSQEEILATKVSSIHADGDVNLICNDCDQVWDCLKQQSVSSSSSGTYHIVLDNAGSELFQDLILADWLIQSGVASRVVFHCKILPWFVSDAREADVHWLLEQLIECDDALCASLAVKWQKFLTDGQWSLQSSYFWTTGLSFWYLPQYGKDLLQQFNSAECRLIIFKGDLNYRKLVYDCNYPFPYTTPFQEAVIGLTSQLNAPILALRTCKAETLAGLKNSSVASNIDKIEFDNDHSTLGGKKTKNSWLVNGKYGIIQYHLGRLT
ncbi:hypothetical protein MIR68_000612 [Amoeboaphelidium protococcarum]|nr:hypothetical protein MIR68_000612 [Amoeboaphelidium protococcarum]